MEFFKTVSMLSVSAGQFNFLDLLGKNITVFATLYVSR